MSAPTCPSLIALRRCVLPAPFTPVTNVNGGKSAVGSDWIERCGELNESFMLISNKEAKLKINAYGSALDSEIYHNCFAGYTHQENVIKPLSIALACLKRVKTRCQGKPVAYYTSIAHQASPPIRS